VGRLQIDAVAATTGTSLAILLLVSTPLLSRTHPSIPRKILVQDKWFQIYENPHTPEEISGGVGKWGVCNCKAGYIQIDPNQTDDQKRDTLWHELNHALNDCDTQFGKYVDYDNIFSDMIPAQLQVLRDNPNLAKFLLADSRSKNGKTRKLR
jgi:hypothetical protein